MTETPIPAEKPTILVVDDTPDNIVLLTSLLKGQFKTKVATNGAKALEIALVGPPPDLILLDIMMPEMDGFEVCRHLKEKDELKDVPVIFLSALNETVDKVKAFRAGGVDYITKPFQLEEVRARVDTHLKIRRLQAELEKQNRQLQENFEQLRRLNKRIESEILFARSIQMSLVPKSFPAFPGRGDFDLFAVLEPAREIGGDFYDYFMFDDETLCFVIGDVSGKGVPAALFMAVTRTFIRSIWREERNPAKTLERVNNDLCLDNDTAMFVTLFCGLINLPTGSLRYARGGHNPPFVVRAAGDVSFIPWVNGPLVGLFPGVIFDEQEITLARGDTLFLYTDGVSEAWDTQGQMFGEQRIIKQLCKTHGAGCEQLIGGMAEALRAYTTGAEQSDDITMLAFRYLK
ncbi:MAG: SpoIIE family protein phosphatase [Candidatus Sumerlaeota bacterium]|nr:SpoIIE family protein phosphatase [Candidatus Sumerlaeota bacterium]